MFAARGCTIGSSLSESHAHSNRSKIRARASHQRKKWRGWAGSERDGEASSPKVPTPLWAAWDMGFADEGEGELRSWEI